jgi:hypothetical protein
MSCSSNLSAPVTTSITQFCTLSRNELLFKSQYKEQYKLLTNREEQLKSTLMKYMEQVSPPNKKWIVKCPTNEVVRIKLKQTTSQKTINEDRLKEVIELNPTPEELIHICHNLKTSQSSFIEVYSTWFIRKLYEYNTVKKTELEIKEEEKQKIVSSSSSSSPPPEILETISKLIQIQQNKSKLTRYKQEFTHQIINEKKKCEPILDTFLSTKPPHKQEQKVTLNVQGEIKPFYIQRVMKTYKPSLTLSRSKPLVHHVIQSIITSRFPEINNKPFHVDDLNKIYNIQNFKQDLFSEFQKQLQQYKQDSQKIQSNIVFKPSKMSTPTNTTH